MQINLFLVCQNCPVKHRNYRTSKSKNLQNNKLALKKFCRFCRSHQTHKEELVK